MTVMPSGCDVADKAVSTEDTTSELIRIDAVLSALVKTKVEAMKAASKGKWTSSAPTSPRRPRLTSSSTASSSQNHQWQPHHPESHKKHRRERKEYLERHRDKRYDSAPCEKYIQDIKTHHCCINPSDPRRRQRSSEMSKSSRKRHRHSRMSHILSEELDIGLESPLELLNEHDLTLINFERAQEGLNDAGEYSTLHHQSAYFSQSTAQLKIRYDHEDVALDLEDELDDVSLDCLELSMLNLHEQESYHRPRKKRKKKRRRIEDLPEMPAVVLVDHDELPPRARWTIVATACLLFAMSLLLVGVTLRMAPIIDDMVRKENEELLNSLNRDTSIPENTTVPP